MHWAWQEVSLPLTLRRLVRAPGFALTTSVTLALAVGANAAIFSIVNALWLRPLPVADPQAIVVPYYPVVHSNDGELLDDVRLPAALELAGLSSFSSVTYELNPASRLGDWRPTLQASATETSPAATAVAFTYFTTLGVAVQGRTFREDEDGPGAPPVAIVSARFWRRMTGADQFSAGRALATSTGAVPVVGVAAAGFNGPRLGDQVDVWITIGALEHFSEYARGPVLRQLMPVVAFARLRPGVERTAAEAEVRTVLDRRTTLRTLRDVAFPLRSEGALIRQHSLILTLWTAAVLILLLGCANLASLFIARTLSSRRQLAVRLALGSSRGRLLRHAGSEVLVLTSVGLALGLMCRTWMLTAVRALDTSAGVPIRLLDLTLDWRTVVFGAVVCAVSVAIASAGVVHHAARTDLSGVLAGTATTISRTALRVRQGLLAGHVAFAMTLLVAALALVAAVGGALRQDLGFDRDRTIFANVRPRLLQYAAGDEAREPDYRRALTKLAQTPGIAGVSYGPNLFTARAFAGETPVSVDGARREILLARLEAGPGFLTAAGATFIEGRDLTQADADTAATGRSMMRFVTLRRLNRTAETAPNDGRAPAVIDERLARTLWPGSSALGRSFLWRPLQITYQVVGVVKDLGTRARGEPAVPTLVAPLPVSAYDATRGLGLVIRTSDKAEAAVPAVTSLLREMFPGAPILTVDTARRLLADEMAQERMGARLFMWYAVTAVILGLAGVYGMLLFMVAESRRELGIRAALGASVRGLLRLTMGHALKPVLLGTAGGLVLAYFLSKAMTASIVGLGDIGPGVYALAACLFVAAATLAALRGARGVRTLIPADVLRAD